MKNLAATAMRDSPPPAQEIKPQTNHVTQPTTNLPEPHAKTFEAGLAHHFHVKAELDDANREIGELRQHLAQSSVEIEALRSLNNMLESRMAGLMAERDLAVASRAKLEGLFSVILASMREFKIPDLPEKKQ